jgi:hypothetical protein
MQKIRRLTSFHSQGWSEPLLLTIIDLLIIPSRKWRGQYERDGSGLPKSQYSADNSIHLNAAGNAIWRVAIQAALATV